jgi:predicted trehalose synthase
VSAAKSLALVEAAISEAKTAAGMTARVDGDAHRPQLVVA